MVNIIENCFNRYLKKNHFIDFARPAKWNCPMPEIEQPSMTAVYAATNVKTTPALTSSEEEYYDEPTTSAPKRTNGIFINIFFQISFF